MCTDVISAINQWGFVETTFSFKKNNRNYKVSIIYLSIYLSILCIDKVIKAYTGSSFQRIILDKKCANYLYVFRNGF